MKRRKGTRKPRLKGNLAVDAVPVTPAELRALKSELERRMRSPGAKADRRGDVRYPPIEALPRPKSGTAPRAVRRRPSRARVAALPSKPAPLRWNPDPDDVQRSVAQLVLTIVEFLRLLMERQAIRRMEQKTLTKKEVEAVGQALMQLEETVRDIGKRFGLKPEDLNLDLGPVKLI